MTTAEEIAAEVQRAMGKGMKAAAIFANARLKEIVSVPPTWKRRVKTSTGKERYIVPPATKGAPPRKITGNFRRNMTYRVSGTKIIVGNPSPQARRLEYEDHAYIQVLINKYLDDIIKIAIG